jgi:hypothetical protein
MKFDNAFLAIALVASLAVVACARDLLAPVHRPSNVNPYHTRHVVSRHTAHAANPGACYFLACLL